MLGVTSEILLSTTNRIIPEPTCSGAYKKRQGVLIDVYSCFVLPFHLGTIGPNINSALTH
jgi:hypothetical protein